jgi:hypothetical protein
MYPPYSARPVSHCNPVAAGLLLPLDLGALSCIEAFRVMPYQRLARHVLAEWREIENRLLLIDPLQPEAEDLIAEAHRLREEYQHLIEEATAHERPVPPPFPELDPLGHERGEGPDIAYSRR